MSESSHRSNGALSAAERDALQVMFDRLSGSYYEVLGVARDCDRAALRGAYFDQLERFSSERFEGRDLGGYALHIEAITREINMAFAVLGEPDRRAQYDRRLALSSDLRGVEEVVRDTRTPMPVTQRTNPKTPPPMYGRDVRTSPVQGRDVPNPPPAIARDARTPAPVMARHAPSVSPTVQSPPPPRSVVPPTSDPQPPARRPSQPPPARRPSQPPPARSSSHPSPASGNGALPSGMALESLGRLRAENRSREARPPARLVGPDRDGVAQQPDDLPVVVVAGGLLDEHLEVFQAALRLAGAVLRAEPAEGFERHARGQRPVS